MNSQSGQTPAKMTPTTVPGVSTKKQRRRNKFSYEDMIILALKGLGEQVGGCSLQMIKDYITTHFHLPLISPSSNNHLKKALEKAIENQRIQRLTGGGLTGSFQLVNSGKSPFKKPQSRSRSSSVSSSRLSGCSGVVKTQNCDEDDSDGSSSSDDEMEEAVHEDINNNKTIANDSAFDISINEDHGMSMSMGKEKVRGQESGGIMAIPLGNNLWQVTYYITNSSGVRVISTKQVSYSGLLMDEMMAKLKEIV